MYKILSKMEELPKIRNTHKSEILPNPKQTSEAKSEPKQSKIFKFKVHPDMFKTCLTLNTTPSFGKLPTINMNTWNHLVDRSCNFTNAVWAKDLRNNPELVVSLGYTHSQGRCRHSMKKISPSTRQRPRSHQIPHLRRIPSTLIAAARQRPGTRSLPEISKITQYQPKAIHPQYNLINRFTVCVTKPKQIKHR